MLIQIDGTNTVNKGAELMLYAILQEIEREHPDAKVIYNCLHGKANFLTDLNLVRRPFYPLLSLLNKFRLPGILNRLSIPSNFITTKYPQKGIDLIIDAGGFQFGDQWNLSDTSLKMWKNYYSKLKSYGTKLIFLPQAFGPFETVNWKKIPDILSYADIIFAREPVSYNYLIKAGINEDKIRLYPDFTAIVKGIIPKQYEFLKGGVCIIPNMRMLDKGGLSRDKYIYVLCRIIETVKQEGKKPYLLNHEGKYDSYLCELINHKLSQPVAVVDNLNALEVKGVISQSYIVISSRFHGVASSLNSGIPCLATSWSHKYAELFKDYNQSNCLLDFTNEDETIKQINNYLSKETYDSISNTLRLAQIKIAEKNKEMWKMCWDVYSK